jgi:hypothetical protein
MQILAGLITNLLLTIYCPEERGEGAELKGCESYATIAITRQLNTQHPQVRGRQTLLSWTLALTKLLNRTLLSLTKKYFILGPI